MSSGSAGGRFTDYTARSTVTNPVKRKTPLRVLVVLTCILWVSGCATSSPWVESEADTLRLDALTADVSVPAKQGDFHYLPVELRQYFDENFGSGWSEVRKFRALRKYLFDDDQLNLQYDATATGTAEETWQTRRGNCLSVTNLFVASARYLGLESEYQTVSVRPTWEQEGTTLIRYEHIVAVGTLDSGDDYIVDFLPEFSATGRRTQTISDRNALALYFNNLAAEAIVRGDYESAEALGLVSIKLWPNLSDAWNNIGATYRRLNRYELAELSYRRALRLDRNNYSALANLTQFYVDNGREKDAEQHLIKVNRYNRRNPYYHYYLARLNYSSADYVAARGFLENAIRLKRDDPAFYSALSDTYRKLDDPVMADKLAKKAATIKPIKRRYRAERKPWARVFTLSR